VSGASRGIDRIKVVFDDPNLVANAGLLVPATLMARLGLEALINATVRLVGRVGGASPGRKVLTLVAAILAGGSHIDHANMLRAGATQAVLPFRVMAPSTPGTFLRAFTFGHIRQLDRVIAETIRRAWELGAGSGSDPLVIDLDSRSARSTATRSRAPPTVTPAPSATARSSLPGLIPARCCTPACARAPASGAPNASLRNSSPGPAGPEPPGRSACGLTAGSGRMT
jgi:hypothetical protein